jgi:hypothetical protein
MKLRGDFRNRGRRLLAGTAAVLLPVWAIAASAASEKIFEANITNDLTISSGEPQIAVDPTNPRNLAIVEFGTGSVTRPAYAFNPVILADLLQDLEGAMANTGRVMLSKDGGNHWAQSGPPPAYDPNVSPHTGGGDPFIAYGPDGTLYVGDEAGPAPKPGSTTAKTTYQIYAELLPRSNVTVAASRDGGKSFGAPQSAGTPVDRPWITVDRTTGTVYTASTGPYNPISKAHNVPGEEAPNDRWLVAWQPNLVGKSEPRRMGGPDFSAGGGSTLTAAHGVVAATFVLGQPAPGGFTSAQPAPVPVADSLKSLITDGTSSCSIQSPCLFFETSADEGQHWTRHHVPVVGGFSGQRTNVAADPGRPGRYAISVLNPARTNFLILVTDDSGATWSRPATVPETASGVNFKQWMDYGPTGVLGLVWKKQRDDLTPPSPPPSGPPEVAFRSALAPAFDVYSAISCDGGNNWRPPVRMNAETSPAGPAGNDDLSYISLDAKYAHMVWGDRRMLTKVKNVEGASGGLQAYYGRLPFSAVSNGAACGRKK